MSAAVAGGFFSPEPPGKPNTFVFNPEEESKWRSEAGVAGAWGRFIVRSQSHVESGDCTRAPTFQVHPTGRH